MASSPNVFQFISTKIFQKKLAALSIASICATVLSFSPTVRADETPSWDTMENQQNELMRQINALNDNRNKTSSFLNLAPNVTANQPAPVQPNWQLVTMNRQMQYFIDANYVRPIENGKAFITRAISDQKNDKITYFAFACNSNKYMKSLNENDFSQSSLLVIGPNSFAESVRDDVCQHGAVHRNLQNLIMMGKIYTYGQFYNGLIQHAAGGH